MAPQEMRLSPNFLKNYGKTCKSAQALSFVVDACRNYFQTFKAFRDTLDHLLTLVQSTLLSTLDLCSFQFLLSTPPLEK